MEFVLGVIIKLIQNIESLTDRFNQCTFNQAESREPDVLLPNSSMNQNLKLERSLGKKKLYFLC